MPTLTVSTARLLATAFLLFAIVVTSRSVQAVMRFPVPYNDYCTWLGEKRNDPYLERDFDRCEFAKDALRKQGRAADEGAFAEYCVWLANRTRKPGVATDDQACAKESTRVGSEETTNWNHPNRVALRDFLSGLQLSSQKTQCDWLADKKYGKKLLTGKDDNYRSACWEFQRKQYAENPQLSRADYDAYCLYLAKSVPHLDAADSKTFCPDIEKELRLQKGTAATMQGIEQNRRNSTNKDLVMGAFVLIGLVAAAYFLFVVLPKRREKSLAALYQARMEKVLAGAGRTREERAAVLSRSFDRRDATLGYEEGGSNLTLDKDVFASMSFVITRTLATMDPAELTALRTLYLLANENLIDPRWFDWQRFALIYGDGKASIGKSDCKMAKTYNEPMREFPTALSLYARRRSASASAAVTNVLSCLHRLEQQQPEDPVIKKLRSLVVGGGEWLAEGELVRSVFNVEQNFDRNLLLGKLPSGLGLRYRGDGSLVTIAPPGAGKSHCHVIPNLLAWNRSALVLDVKNELFSKTRNWREADVGPVYRFAPLDPENSHCFNPLDFVRGDRFNVWEDAIYLADLFMVRMGEDDKFWDKRARDLLAAIIAYACCDATYVSPEIADRHPRRAMATLHAVANRVGWNEFVASLGTIEGVMAMREEGNSLGKMEDKTLDGVLQTLKVTLQAWSGERVRHVTRKSDWKPIDLRTGSPTVYLCLSPGEIDAFASVLRVFVGVHLRTLTAGEPPANAPPIAFFLDEMPRLKYMPPIVEALDTGRSYGIRLWMFAQNLGQLREVYKNADGMIGSCAVQCYMNPSLHDGTAEHVSKMIGERLGALDGRRDKVVEAPALAGPDYEDKVIVFGKGSQPALLTKAFAFNTPLFKERMEMPRRTS